MSVTAPPARTHGATSPLRSRPAVRRFLEGPPLDPADLSLVLLVTEEEVADRAMPTLAVAQPGTQAKRPHGAYHLLGCTKGVTQSRRSATSNSGIDPGHA